MGKGGRIACIFTPYLLTIGALVCLIFVGLGVTSPNAPLNDIYFVKADLKDLNLNSKGFPQELLPFTNSLQQADGSGKLHDFYLIGLWNHCYGEYENGQYKIIRCTDRKAKYWFDPVKEWDLEDLVKDKDGHKFLPSSLDKGLSAYRKVAGWMFIAFIVALVATCVELLVGIAAVFSRWGSLAVTIVSSVSSVFFFAAAITATAMYAALTAAVNTSLKPYDVHASLGKTMFSTLWLGVAFSLASGIFWLFSVCCCSGRSPYSHSNNSGSGFGGRRNRGITAEKTPYTYERVSDPYGGAATAPFMPAAAGSAPVSGAGVGGRDMAYEPFRHHDAHA
ncbi:integral membrane protein [Histoplasma capsulatum]|uniref:Integral membrane protein n=1 Tax=Ajellomyces capsulatus TaxID=5037 RepID=A0A8A1MKX2_AJECA|nr:predicted protein [Histoplasma mississippiense (nom. inval.)]EDN11324.1 predicted protein [Histoplasma mississippiense (nom. inval.)]QSS66771.1 integral membrane protein [Histoplasma capsulatum]